MGKDGYAVVDETLEHPRSVFQLMKAHFSRYTPEMVEKICGTPKDKFLKVCRDDRGDVHAGQGHDDHVRAGVDAALARFARTSARRR